MTSAASFEEIAWVVKSGLYFNVSCLSICLYDHVTTFDQEVELIWKKRLSLVQVLYFTNRYVGAVYFMYGVVVQLWLPQERFLKRELHGFRCPSFWTVSTWSSMISVLSYQGIMVHRIYSLCQRRRAILIVMMVWLGGLFITGLALAIAWTISVTGTPAIYGPTLRICLSLDQATWSSALWFVVMAFDLAIFVLAVSEGRRYLRDNRKTPRTREDAAIIGSWPALDSHVSMLGILLRDSVIFPLLGILICLSNVLALYVLPLGVLQYTLGVAILSSPILGSRLILNLREAYYRPFAVEIELSRL